MVACRHFRAPAAAGSAVLALLAPLMLAPSSAWALVIDNFEQGAFALVATPGSPQQSVVAVTQGVNCIASQRFVTLSSFGPDPAGAQLFIANPDDESQMVMPQNGGHLLLEYRPVPAADVTAGGVLGRIDVRFTVAVPAGQIEVTLRDAAMQEDTVIKPLTGPGTYSVLLSDYAVDATAITTIRVLLNALAVQGDFHIADIRAKKVNAAAAVYDASNAEPVGPPYPAPPLPIEAMSEDQAIALGTRDFAMHRADDGGGRDLRTRLLGRDSGGPVGTAGHVGEVQAFWLPGGFPYPAESFFDVFLEIDPPAGREFDLDGAPVLFVGSPGTFVVGYAVTSTPGGGGRGGGDEIAEVLRFDIGPGQPLVFENVSAPPDPVEPTFNVRFKLQLTGVVPNPEIPLYTVALNGDFNPAATAGIESAEAPVPALRFWAEPSVMSEATELHLDVPLAVSTPLVLYHVSGRSVRSLPLRAGETGVRWDGRDASGHESPAGVYMARLEIGKRALVTRIVKLP
jgi:hypothetical protein